MNGCWGSCCGKPGFLLKTSSAVPAAWCSLSSLSQPILTLAVALLYPQLRDSIKLLISNLPGYEENLVQWVDEYLPDLQLSEHIPEYYAKLIKALPDMLSTAAPHLFNFTTSAASVVTDSFIALVLSFYFLISKDRLLGTRAKAAAHLCAAGSLSVFCRSAL